MVLLCVCAYICVCLNFLLINLHRYAHTDGLFAVKWAPPEVLNYRKFSHKSDGINISVPLVGVYVFNECVCISMCGCVMYGFLCRTEHCICAVCFVTRFDSLEFWCVLLGAFRKRQR